MNIPDELVRKFINELNDISHKQVRWEEELKGVSIDTLNWVFFTNGRTGTGTIYRMEFVTAIANEIERRNNESNNP